MSHCHVVTTCHPLKTGNIKCSGIFKSIYFAKATFLWHRHIYVKLVCVIDLWRGHSVYLVWIKG